MNLTIEHRDNIVIFSLKSSNLDSEKSAQLKAKILIECQPNIDAMIIDITDVEYIESSGLGALLLANRQLSELDIPLLIVGAQEPVMSLIRISQLEDIFNFYPSIDEGINALEEEEE